MLPPINLPLAVSSALRQSLMRTYAGTPMLITPSGRRLFLNYAMRVLMLVVALRCRQVVEIGPRAWGEDCGDFIQGVLF